MIAAMLHALLMMTVASTPCADESANNCRWDVATSGNGQGVTYVVLADERTACIYYPTHRAWDYCEDVS